MIETGFDSTTSNYRKLEIWLHDLALGKAFVAKALFNLECDLAGAGAGPHSDNPVFVMGMARSGTTIILQQLAETGAFAYLTYRQMPFVTAPVLASKLARLRPTKLRLRQRSHADGLTISLDSPEAFEEVFWRAVAGATSVEDSYNYKPISEDQKKTFETFRRQVVAAAERSTPNLRYLSKNNNNIGRITDIAAIPGSKILLCIREPAATATSSLRLHQTTSQHQLQNQFMLRYMNYLGHHEFGKNHLRFDFAGTSSPAGYQTSDVNYWLEYWLMIHQSLLAKLGENHNIRVLANADLRQKPAAAFNSVLEFIGVEKNIRNEDSPASALAQAMPPVTFSPDLLAQADSIYAKLINHPQNLMRRHQTQCLQG